MAQETVTEYKTVEEQKTRTLCDNCNRTDEEAEILTVAINPKETVTKKRDFEVFKMFDDYMEAQDAKINLEHNKLQKPDGYLSGDEKYGLGMTSQEYIRSMGVSAKADVCSECVFDLFGVEIPEDEEVEEIELGNGQLNINTTKEVTTVWPQIPEWNDGKYPIPELGWKGKIFTWPVSFMVSLYELMAEVLTGDEERQKGYVAGSLGAILWTGMILTVLYLTSFIVFAV
jgi:hypothetical protein